MKKQLIVLALIHLINKLQRFSNNFTFNNINERFQIQQLLPSDQSEKDSPNYSHNKSDSPTDHCYRRF